MSPKISIIMSVYNSARYLKKAVYSILNQTLTDFEFIIINDGSTDSTAKYINCFSDKRIKVINNEKNIGLTKSLNIGIRLAKGKYIARMDADDICVLNRLVYQYDYLEKHPDIGLCGGWAKKIGEKSNLTTFLPLDYEEIKCYLVFNNPIIHPTVMIRKRSLYKYNLFYNEKLKAAQDYELWTRCAKYFPLVNIPRVLLYFRVHENQISTGKLQEQQKYADQVRHRQLKELFSSDNNYILNQFVEINKDKKHINKEYLNKIEKWLLKMISYIEENKKLSLNVFKKIVSYQWFNLCNRFTGQRFTAWNIYWNSPASQYFKLSFVQRVRFFLKCFIKIN